VTFEEDFPSLSKCPSSCGFRKGQIGITMEDVKKGQIGRLDIRDSFFHVLYIETFCLDKQKVKAFVDKHWPEKPVTCFAQAMRYGSSQKEREEVIKELGL